MIQNEIWVHLSAAPPIGVRTAASSVSVISNLLKSGELNSSVVKASWPANREEFDKSILPTRIIENSVSLSAPMVRPSSVTSSHRIKYECLHVIGETACLAAERFVWSFHVILWIYLNIWGQAKPELFSAIRLHNEVNQRRKKTSFFLILKSPILPCSSVTPAPNPTWTIR